MPTPGDRIREAREGRGLTQDELARAATVSKGFLSDVENNKRNISVEYALRIADTLGISLDYLMRGEQGRAEVEREPVKIPPELSLAAQELNLTYSETLMLLDAHEAVVARRSSRSVARRTIDDWKMLHKAIRKAYPNASNSDK
jgi:transcriptional regulator with XRE-family HTH domain